MCGGKGVIVSEMAFMDAIETKCEACGGLRFSQEALSFKYNGKNIGEVMDMSVSQAIEFFKGKPFVDKLESLEKVGLGYIHLNQSMSTLSGGELQRVKLADKLKEKGQVFILDEPTDGLHLDDIKRLKGIFNDMADAGNTLFIIEHSLDVMKDADYIVEMGPEGGLKGGSVLFSGRPCDIMDCEKSVTGRYIKESLE
ncbi:MAG: ATP-binding cassette domain-containing protein [Oscillospiraceae bacterium]|nr:ATP-binding cassette domain-containing protein [Oscillospiraceae bacterium]